MAPYGRSVTTGGKDGRHAGFIGGDPWFVAKDVCAALGLSDTSRVLAGLDEDEKGTSTVRTLGYVMGFASVSGNFH